MSDYDEIISMIDTSKTQKALEQNNALNDILNSNDDDLENDTSVVDKVLTINDILNSNKDEKFDVIYEYDEDENIKIEYPKPIEPIVISEELQLGIDEFKRDLNSNYALDYVASENDYEYAFGSGWDGSVQSVADKKQQLVEQLHASVVTLNAIEKKYSTGLSYVKEGQQIIDNTVSVVDALGQYCTTDDQARILTNARTQLLGLNDNIDTLKGVSKDFFNVTVGNAKQSLDLIKDGIGNYNDLKKSLTNFSNIKMNGNGFYGSYNYASSVLKTVDGCLDGIIDLAYDAQAFADMFGDIVDYIGSLPETWNTVKDAFSGGIDNISNMFTSMGSENFLNSLPDFATNMIKNVKIVQDVLMLPKMLWQQIMSIAVIIDSLEFPTSIMDFISLVKSIKSIVKQAQKAMDMVKDVVDNLMNIYNAIQSGNYFQALMLCLEKGNKGAMMKDMPRYDIAYPQSYAITGSNGTKTRRLGGAGRTKDGKCTCCEEVEMDNGTRFNRTADGHIELNCGSSMGIDPITGKYEGDRGNFSVDCKDSKFFIDNDFKVRTKRNVVIDADKDLKLTAKGNLQLCGEDIQISGDIVKLTSSTSLLITPTTSLIMGSATADTTLSATQNITIKSNLITDITALTALNIKTPVMSIEVGEMNIMAGSVSMESGMLTLLGGVVFNYIKENFAINENSTLLSEDVFMASKGPTVISGKPLTLNGVAGIITL